MKGIIKKLTMFFVITAMLLSCMLVQISAFAAGVTPVSSDVGGEKLVNNIKNGAVIKIADDLKHSGDNIYYISSDGKAKKKQSADTVGTLKISIESVDKKASYVSFWSYEGKGYVYAVNIKAENGNNLYVYENGEKSDTDLDCYETCGFAPHINYIEFVMSLRDISEKSADDEKEEDTSIHIKGAEYAYIFGYEPVIKTTYDGKGRKNEKLILRMAMDDNVTVEQVSAMLMRLLDQDGNTTDVDYPVTSAVKPYKGTWYERGLAYQCAVGGFDPEGTINIGDIKRGQVAKLVSCALKLNLTGETKFEDISDNQYKEYIEKVCAYGYMQGVDDKHFEPDRTMTRGEFCSMFNKIIGRDDDKEFPLTAIDKDGKEYQVTAETYYFTDMDPNHWAYKDCLKATSAYDNGYVDVEERIKNIRNKLDKYDAQIQY